MDDTISRRAAIAVADSSDYVGLSVEDVKKVTDEVVKGLKRLPSAQPEPCEDAVSREAVSEWLKQYGQDVLHGKYKFSLMYIWKNLMDLPSAQPQRWIPCSERTPEKAYGQYWVCTDTGYQCQCRWTDDVYGLGSSGEWTWKIFDIPQYSHVVAWMPLPEPYKERREE